MSTCSCIECQVARHICFAEGEGVLAVSTAPDLPECRTLKVSIYAAL